MNLTRVDRARYGRGEFTPVEAFAFYLAACTDRQAAAILAMPDPVAAAHAAYREQVTS